MYVVLAAVCLFVFCTRRLLQSMRPFVCAAVQVLLPPCGLCIRRHTLYTVMPPSLHSDVVGLSNFLPSFCLLFLSFFKLGKVVLCVTASYIPCTSHKVLESCVRHLFVFGMCVTAIVWIINSHQNSWSSERSIFVWCLSW